MQGRICGVCHAAAKLTQQAIDAMPAPDPENPEDRAVQQMQFFRDWLQSHPEATTRMKLHVKRQIARLDAIVREWMPTQYRRNGSLRGGKG